MRRGVSFVIAAMFLVTAAADIVHAGPLFESTSTAEPWTFDVQDRKQLFLDDQVIAEVSAISTFQGRPAKYPGNPIIVDDKPWETEAGAAFPGVQLHGQTVLFDEQEQVFKMWYHPSPWNRPEEDIKPWCYAVSRDGYHWEKPNLGLVDYKGSKENNIVYVTTAITWMGVVKTPHDPDPSRLYKAFGELEPRGDFSRHGACIAFSPDGLHWTEHENNPVIRKGPNYTDASVIMGWDPRIKKYVAYPRPGRPQAVQWLGDDNIRAIGHAESDDFIHWTPTRIMLTPDEHDRVDNQYMAFNAAFDPATRMYLGLLPIHQTHEQTWDTYLLSSRDGFHWTWIDRHTPFLGRGEKGSYDSGYQHAAVPIVHDNTVFIYYGAYQGAHSLDVNPNPLGRFPGPTRMSIALATMPVDRYVGLLAGPRTGTIATRPLTFKGSRLLIDFDASLPIKRSEPRRLTAGEAEVRVALLDHFGRPYSGFTLDKCKPMLESGVQEVVWENVTIDDVPEERGWYTQPGLGWPNIKRRVRILFQLRHAALYSFQFTD